MVAAREIVLRALFEKSEKLEGAEDIHLDISAPQRSIEAGCVREHGSWLSLAPTAEITARCQILSHFGRIERRAAKGNPAGLQLVPVSRPWRSLGGFLDYEHWTDRDRFVELDGAISSMHGEADDIPSGFTVPSL